jgi:DUF1680 family protein
MTAAKTYVTGGLGSRWHMEAFGDPYELPTDRAYAETCAAIGGVQWAWRMLLATGEARYADVAERMLYNGFLAGVSLGGDEYFYVNPLQHRTGAHPDENRSPAHGRRGWFDCACCPPNIMRMLSSLDGYLATTDAEGIQLHLYATAEVGAEVDAGPVRLAVGTEYPWDGTVRVEVLETPEQEWTLSLRVPAWADGAALRVGGDEQQVSPGAYARARRAWRVGDVVELRLPMTARFTVADPRVDAVRGCVAVERGPLVYAVEQVDQADGVLVDDVVVDPTAPPRADHRPDLLGGVTTLRLRGAARPFPQSAWPYAPEENRVHDDPAPRADLTAVPYYAWANRGTGPMRVWLPRA